MQATFIKSSISFFYIVYVSEMLITVINHQSKSPTITLKSMYLDLYFSYDYLIFIITSLFKLISFTHISLFSISNHGDKTIFQSLVHNVQSVLRLLSSQILVKLFIWNTHTEYITILDLFLYLTMMKFSPSLILIYCSFYWCRLPNYVKIVKHSYQFIFSLQINFSFSFSHK